MIIKTRGSQIAFTQVFVDADGLQTTVGSANLVVVYPSSTPSGAILSHDPGQLKGKQVLPMTVNSDGSWSATWDSSIAEPGIVYWNARSATPTLVEDGEIVLRANLANLEAF